MTKITNTFLIVAITLAGSGCVSVGHQNKKNAVSNNSKFTLAVIPDTQNYLDYTNQKKSGFDFDASELFIQQMRYIADNAKGNGGDIAFVAAVGDIWQHQTKSFEHEHKAPDIIYAPNPLIESMVKVTPETLTVEIPKAIEGYQILSNAKIPFGVAPGNHDYDSIWTTTKFPPNLNKPKEELTLTAADIGILHIGGLNNFKSVFGNDKAFFKDKNWYIASYNGGTSSAQRFTAGGYTFLHIALEMHPGDQVVAWAKSVIMANLGLPTIFTTHDYLDINAERKGHPIEDSATVDSVNHNNAQAVWEKLYSQYPQVLLVLSGHQHGQSNRVDENRDGYLVYQILSDYQDRSQVSVDMQKNNLKPTKLGDGWLRLMEFDLNQNTPNIKIKTYSSYYQKFSSQEKDYAKWYKMTEHPELSDKEFLATDEYTLELSDFHSRFRANIVN